MNLIPASRRFCSTAPATRCGKTVLVVDDSAPVCDLVAWHLSGTGYGVITVNDPLEAQNIISSEVGSNIDLLLTDVEMPEMRGDELAVWCAKVRPQMRVIIMSGNPNCLPNPSAVGCLEKPFSLAQLSAAVRDAFAFPAQGERSLSSVA